MQARYRQFVRKDIPGRAAVLVEGARCREVMAPPKSNHTKPCRAVGTSKQKVNRIAPLYWAMGHASRTPVSLPRAGRMDPNWQDSIAFFNLVLLFDIVDRLSHVSNTRHGLTIQARQLQLFSVLIHQHYL
ncbi:hypothetical protein SS50377_28676 [Spironucleus salmonicida]|uniref:Uncharacterized protein n=1 Tax=Spironucleus salmonicida TaxID=348837 RepID=A0A9P8LKC4_9EUKA|nr:hypothetical protein SS50377_28676 [Spironucleus salmonicida]